MKRRHRVGKGRRAGVKTTSELVAELKRAQLALASRVGRRHMLQIQTEDDPRYRPMSGKYHEEREGPVTEPYALRDVPRRHQLRLQEED